MRKRTIVAALGALASAIVLVAGCSRPDDGASLPGPLAPSEGSTAPTETAPIGAGMLSPAVYTSQHPGVVARGDDAEGGTLDATAVLTLASVDTVTGDLVVGGYVSGVIEDGGSCTYTATDATSGRAITVRAPGVANNDTTSCGSASVPATQVPAGDYSVVLTYANDVGRTSSSPLTVEVKR